MTPQQIELVKTTFAKAAAQQPSLGIRLYGRLFQARPDLIELFRGDRTHQAHSVVQMLDTIVGCLGVQDRVVPLVFELGRRHASYGVRPEHYQVFGDALLGALRDALPGEFTAPEQAAWQAAFSFMAEIMQEAAPAIRT
jgi:methyl-accepting chemotaxis protein